MNRLGILAYGSLLDWVGKEIEPLIINRIDVTTPFNVEFARSSSKRSGAPTLIPVEQGGTKIRAKILGLREGTTEDHAKNILWRRETYQIGKTKKTYKEPKDPGKNDVVIRQIENSQGMDKVFYTKIGANIEPLTPEKLAHLAIESYNSKTASLGLDGITYLFNAKMRGIQTPLMPAYEKEILKKLGASDLEEAQAILYLNLLKAEGKIPKETQRLERPVTEKDAGKFVAIRATIGKTYVKLSPPIVLTVEYNGEKYSSSFRTTFLGLEAEIRNSYLFVGFKKKTGKVEVIDYFNNLMAIFNIVSIPFDFISTSDILLEAEGSTGKMEFISSSKAHCRGYGIPPVEISMLDFSKVVLAILVLWAKIKRSKYFEEDNFFQLLGYAHNYFFHQNYFLSFVHAFIFLEAGLNVLWRELINQSYVNEKKTPLDEESGTE